MEHLSTEALAHLVDEAPRPEEAEHLAACRTCASELDALRAQTRALASLPEIRPPLGDWEVLEARLRSEGLVEDPLRQRLAAVGRDIQPHLLQREHGILGDRLAVARGHAR